LPASILAKLDFLLPHYYQHIDCILSAGEPQIRTY